MGNFDGSLEFRRLRALQDTGLLTSPAPPALDEICQRAREHFGVAVALVTLITRHTLLAKARSGLDLEEVPRVGQFCETTIRADEVFVVPDAAHDARFASSAVVTSEPFIRFYAGAPFIYLREIRLGALCLLDPTPREFSLGAKAELALMAEEVTFAIIENEIDRTAAALELGGAKLKRHRPANSRCDQVWAQRP